MNIRQSLVFTLIIATIQFGCNNSGKDIKSFDNPASQPAKYPYLYASGDSLYMSWISTNDSTNALNFSRYANGQWNSPQAIARDSSWFVNWADFPSIIADKNGPVAMHWLNKKSGGTYAYDVNIATMSPSGDWSEPLTPHTDGTATEHGFVSMIPWDDNTILAVWLDGRRSANRTPDEYYDISKAMTLRSALISTAGEIEQEFLIDESVCDCCQTSLIKTDSGAVVAYRNRTDDEIRDIYLSRFDGTLWSKPTAVYQDDWKIGACPVNGPKLAASGSSVLVAWHTAADDKPAAKASISTDYGNSFGKPVTLNEHESLGRVDAAIQNGKGYVSWMEKSPKSKELANLQLASFGIPDTAFQTKTISQLNSARKTGFPQMEVAGDQLIFAWTAIDSTTSTVKTFRAKLP